MASKEELLASLIEEQKVLTEQAQAIAIIDQNAGKSDGHFNVHNETEHEYVYWARRGELETAVEVEVCSSNGSENVEGTNVIYLLYYIFLRSMNY